MNDISEKEKLVRKLKQVFPRYKDVSDRDFIYAYQDKKKTATLHKYMQADDQTEWAIIHVTKSEITIALSWYEGSRFEGHAHNLIEGIYENRGKNIFKLSEKKIGHESALSGCKSQDFLDYAINCRLPDSISLKTDKDTTLWLTYWWSFGKCDGGSYDFSYEVDELTYSLIYDEEGNVIEENLEENPTVVALIEEVLKSCRSNSDLTVESDGIRVR